MCSTLHKQKQRTARLAEFPFTSIDDGGVGEGRSGMSVRRSANCLICLEEIVSDIHLPMLPGRGVLPLHSHREPPVSRLGRPKTVLAPFTGPLTLLIGFI